MPELYFTKIFSRVSRGSTSGNSGRAGSAGFSTLEIMIAFAILVSALSVIIMVTFGNQSTSTSSQTNDEALNQAQQLLEDSRASSSHTNFLDIVSAPAASVSGDIYTRATEVLDISPCAKQVTGFVRWREEARSLGVSLATFLTDPEEALALGGDCASTPPNSDDWKKPNSLSANPAGMEGNGTGIDVKNKIIFLTTKATGANKDDFFIIDATNKLNPVKRGTLDLSEGLEAIDVAGNYAFVANDESQPDHQLQIVNISNLDSPAHVASVSLPGVSGSCPNTCPGGRSIYFYNNKIYMGTHRLAVGGAAEFHVFNVSNPATPVWLGSKGGAIGDSVDHNINAIAVHQQTIGGTTRTYAYLATSADNGELIILNVSNPASIPNPTGTLPTGSITNLGDSTPNDLDATSLNIIGNKLYIGRKRATGADHDFFIFDVSNPSAPILLGSKKIGLNATGSEITSIVITADIAFLGTSDPNAPFQAWDISNPASISRWENSGCEINFSTFVTDMALEDNIIYLSLDAKEQNPKIIEPINGSGGSCH